MASVFPTRTHIAPLGVECDRITEPAIRQGADRVVLIKYLPTAYDERLAIDEIESRLDANGIEMVYERCEGEITDLYDAVAKFGEVMLANRDDELYVNLATGDKDTTIGGMIACMTLDIATPYYVDAEARGTLQRQPPEGIDGIDSIPTYPMERPPDEHVAIMKRIDIGEKVNKSDLIYFAAGQDDTSVYTKEDLISIGTDSNPILPFLSGCEGIFKRRTGKDNPDPFEERISKTDTDPTKAAHMRLQHNIIRPLEEEGFISVDDSRRSHEITLTETGKNILRAYEFVLEQGPQDSE